MNYLTIHEKPDVQLDQMIIAFAGWADAAEAATNTVKYVQRRLNARKFAEIDAEEFYDFTQTRPTSMRTKDGRRRIRWPANEFSWAMKPDGSGGMLFFLGVEPNLRWRAFSQTIAGLAKDMGVKTVVHMGALLDAVPHTRTVRVTGSSSDPALREAFENREIRSSNYQGPTGISSVVLEACASEGMDYASIWGHTSHYLQAAPNYRVSLTMAKSLSRLLNIPLYLEELDSAARTFDEEVEKAIGNDEQVRSYVEKLEARYDEATPPTEMPDPTELVRDLEQYLRSEQRRRPGDAGGG